MTDATVPPAVNTDPGSQVFVLAAPLTVRPLAWIVWFSVRAPGPTGAPGV